MSIPMVRAELELIIEMQTDEFWQDIYGLNAGRCPQAAAESG